MSKITKDKRELLLVINLEDSGQAKWKWLYQWLDASAEAVTKAALAPHYKKITILKGPAATHQNFLDQIEAIATQPHVKALDVILHLHGGKDNGKGELTFAKGAKSEKIKTATLSDQINAKNLSHRLRLLYSVACYGESHAQDFVDAGFRTASGARGVNANSTHDYPTQLGFWASGSYYKTAVKHGNNPALRAIHDNLAIANGFSQANSEKFIKGKKYTRITTGAT